MFAYIRDSGVNIMKPYIILMYILTGIYKNIISINIMQNVFKEMLNGIKMKSYLFIIVFYIKYLTALSL